MASLTKLELHERLLTALPGAEADHDTLKATPLVVKVPTVSIPLAIWAFTLSNPPGGRHPAESKIQLIAPGHQRGERGNLIAPEAHFKLLVGIHPEEDLFVLWDAYQQNDFAWSKNVQVRGEVLWDAEVKGLATGYRRRDQEVVIAAQADRLAEAIRLRIRTT